jgi:hypothetical protein
MLSATQSATSIVNAAFFVRGTTDDVDDDSLLEHAVSTMLAVIKTRSFFIRARFMLATSFQIREKFYTATNSCVRKTQTVVLAPRREVTIRSS